MPFPMSTGRGMGSGQSYYPPAIPVINPPVITPSFPVITPSFRRKPESRKSPEKSEAANRGFWIPAFAGTTVVWVAVSAHPELVEG